jgi:hypothetical protein
MAGIMNAKRFVRSFKARPGDVNVSAEITQTVPVLSR